MRCKVPFHFWCSRFSIAGGPLHGYGITAQIEAISDLLRVAGSRSVRDAEQW
jgi:hypothetical protein